MQNQVVNKDSNSLAKDFYFVQSLPLNQKHLQDSIFLAKSDTIKKNNFLSSKYFSINNQKHDTNISYSPTIFSKHLLTPYNKNNSEITNLYSDWIFIIQFLGLILFTLVIVLFRKRLKQIFNSLFTNRAINQLNRDGDLSKEFILLPLLSIYYLTISLLVLFISEKYFNINKHYNLNLIFYLKILIAIVSFSVLKILLIKFISNAFRNINATFYYLLNTYISNIITGFLVLPFLFLYSFSSNFITDKLLIICILIIFIFYFIRIFRNTFTGINYSRFSSLYLFLYLCTVEFLPVILLTKFINGLVSF